ncbi:hypothetical protein Dsin_004521 [Dipteronia sinensis]|uniref:Uncharacterized protein n=1 Tax=Dipteronia sinensis TaxID=43782 RepID=A0AAE0AW77_9ROSI|nr:hypothetical protein Dsin_004521 [Dipteronia sinensis]
MFEEQVFWVSWGALNAIPSTPLKLLIYCLSVFGCQTSLQSTPTYSILFLFLQNPHFWFLANFTFWNIRALKRGSQERTIRVFSCHFSHFFLSFHTSQFTNTA